MIENPGPTLEESDQLWIGLLKQPLRPIQDVKTRWDSTTQMLIRLRILRKPLEKFLQRMGMRALILTESQWSVVEYLVDLTAPFNAFTQTVGRSSSPSIHSVYVVYNLLFAHIEDALFKLRRKKQVWKVSLKHSLEQAKAKLTKYYGKTSTDPDLDELYAFSALLHPLTRNSAFEESEWRGSANAKGQSYRTIYVEKLREKWEASYRGDIQERRALGSVDQQGIDFIRTRYAKTSSTQRRRHHEPDELDRYFKHCMCSSLALDLSIY